MEWKYFYFVKDCIVITLQKNFITEKTQLLKMEKYSVEGVSFFLSKPRKILKKNTDKNNFCVVFAKIFHKGKNHSLIARGLFSLLILEASQRGVPL